MADEEKKKKYIVPITLQQGVIVNLDTQIHGGVWSKSVALPLTADEMNKLAPVNVDEAPVPPPERPEAPQIDPSWSSTRTEAAMDEWGKKVDAFNKAYVEWVKKYFKVRVTKRETLTVVADAEENDRLTEVRGKARSMITAIAKSHWAGLELCKKDDEPELDEAITAAEELVATTNHAAKHGRIYFNAIKAYIADDSQEKYAIGIANKLTDLLHEMQAGINNRDPEAIDTAVRKANSVKGILDEQSKSRLSAGLKLARASSRDIAKTIETVGNANMVLISDQNKAILASLEKSFTVLDIDAPVTIEGEALAPVAVAEVDVDAEAIPENPDDVGEKAAGSPDGEKCDL